MDWAQWPFLDDGRVELRSGQLRNRYHRGVLGVQPRWNAHGQAELRYYFYTLPDAIVCCSRTWQPWSLHDRKRGPGDRSSSSGSSVMNFPVNGLNKGIGPRLAVVCDVTPDFGKVSSGAGALDDNGHLGLLAGAGSRGSSLAAFLLDLFGIPRRRLTTAKPVANILP